MCEHPECESDCLHTVRLVDASDAVEAAGGVFYWLAYLVFYVPLRFIWDITFGRRRR